MPLFSPDDQDRLSAPHVGRAWFVDITLPTTSPATRLRLHNGVGTLSLGGFEWKGVTDPIGGRLVSIAEVEDPQFGQAPAVSIVLTGTDVEFMRSVHVSARQIEGSPVDVYWAMIDPETGEVLISLKKLFPGVMSSPSLSWQGLGKRIVSFTIESIWAGNNFPSGGKWNGAGQRARYPGDLGLDFVGVKVADNWR